MKTRHNERVGAVSLFIVIFTALLMTIITVSFVRIMLQDQKQATATDLSQSAYDSAQAGVEDAKRALLAYQNTCNLYGINSQECQKYKDMISSDKCNDAVSMLSDVKGHKNGSEVSVQSSGGDTSLKQAYTCLKITLNTPDYLGKLDKDHSKLIPLIGTGTFDTVKIDWFSYSDVAGSKGVVDLQSPMSTSLPLLSSWTVNKPPIMRSQFIQFADLFKLSDFDTDGDANTLFLYPIGKLDSASTSLYNNINIVTADIRKEPTRTPNAVQCSDSLLNTNELYACTAIIKLANPVNYNSGSRTLYLNLSSIYNKANYRVSLYNGADPDPVYFSAVQPQIDSTGRANTLYRRVATRVELTDINFPYPEAAVNVTGNFCKDFSVTDKEIDFNHDLSDSHFSDDGKGVCDSRDGATNE